MPILAERDPRIMYPVGRILLHRGGKAEIGRGMEFIRASAGRGYIPALEFMAQSKLQGVYVPQDVEGAVRDLVAVTRKPLASKKESAYETASALLVVHAFYGFGAFVERDPRRKAALLRESADMGNAAAQYYLGLALVKGSTEIPRDLIEAHKYFVLSWKQDGGIFRAGDLTTPKRWMPAQAPALAVRKKLKPNELKQSRERIRAWLEEKSAGRLGWAFDPEKNRSKGEVEMKELEEMYRDIAAGISSMDFETQMPCQPMVERAARQCVQGHVAWREAPKATSQTSRMEWWTYVSGSATRVYPVRYESRPGRGLRWKILTPR